MIFFLSMSHYRNFHLIFFLLFYLICSEKIVLVDLQQKKNLFQKNCMKKVFVAEKNAPNLNNYFAKIHSILEEYLILIEFCVNPWFFFFILKKLNQFIFERIKMQWQKMWCELIVREKTSLLFFCWLCVQYGVWDATELITRNARDYMMN